MDLQKDQSVNNIVNYFVYSVSGTGGLMALLVFVGLVALTIFFDRLKWVWLTVAVYISALWFSQSPYFDNTLAAPLQQIRPFSRVITTAMLVLLLIPTIKWGRGHRWKLTLGGTILFCAFEVGTSARYMLAGLVSRGGFGLVVYLLIFATLVVGLSRWLQTFDDVHTALRCVLAAGCLMVLGTVYQLAIRAGAIIDNGRLTGTTNNPQHLGTSLAFTLPVACFILIRRQERRFWRITAGAFAAISVIFILWTQSRASALVTLVGLVLFFRARLGQAVFSGAVVAVFFLIFFQVFGDSLPGLNRFYSTLDTRSLIWREQLNIFMAHPLLGSGGEGTAENSYLAALAGHGVIGSLPLAIAVILIGRDLLRLRRLRPWLGEQVPLADLMTGCLVSMLMIGVFEGSLLGTLTDYLFCFFVFLGVAAFLLDAAWQAASFPSLLASEWDEAGTDLVPPRPSPRFDSQADPAADYLASPGASPPRWD